MPTCAASASAESSGGLRPSRFARACLSARVRPSAGPYAGSKSKRRAAVAGHPECRSGSARPQPEHRHVCHGGFLVRRRRRRGTRAAAASCCGGDGVSRGAARDSTAGAVAAARWPPHTELSVSAGEAGSPSCVHTGASLLPKASVEPGTLSSHQSRTQGGAPEAAAAASVPPAARRANEGVAGRPCCCCAPRAASGDRGAGRAVTCDVSRRGRPGASLGRSSAARAAKAARAAGDSQHQQKPSTPCCAAHAPPQGAAGAAQPMCSPRARPPHSQPTLARAEPRARGRGARRGRHCPLAQSSAVKRLRTCAPSLEEGWGSAPKKLPRARAEVRGLGSGPGGPARGLHAGAEVTLSRLPEQST